MPSCTTASLRFLSRCLKTGPLPSGGAGFLCPERCRDNAYLSGQKAFSGMMQGRTALCCGLPRQLLGFGGLPLLPAAPGHRGLSAWPPSYYWACCGLPRQLLGLAGGSRCHLRPLSTGRGWERTKQKFCSLCGKWENACFTARKKVESV